MSCKFLLDKELRFSTHASFYFWNQFSAYMYKYFYPQRFFLRSSSWPSDITAIKHAMRSKKE